MKQPHIALLAPVAPPAGGVQSHTEALRRRALADGFRVSQVAITRSQATPTSDRYLPRNALELLVNIATLKADIIHLHIGGMLTTRLLALCSICAAIPGARTVLTFHSGGFPSSPRGRAASRHSFDGWALRRLDAAIGVNAELAALFRRYGVPADRVHVVAPHASVSPADAESPLPLELERFAASHARLAISVGLLEPEYCLDRQIDAIARLRTAGEDWGLMMIGSGSLHGTLAEQVSRAGLQQHVLLTGDQPHRVALRAIRDADALLRTTAYDGDAVSVREALQLGTPVLASDTGMRPAGVSYLADLDGQTIADALSRLPAGLRVSVEQPDELDRNLALYHALLDR